jgi:hypothetical protein
MKTPFCKREYRQMSSSDLEIFASGVYTGVYGNPTVFVTPTVPKADCDDALSNYSATYSEYRTIGLTKKTPFLNAKAEILSVLNTLATYVDSVAVGEISPIVLSGFTPSSEVIQKNLPLDKITSFDMMRTNVPGEVIVEIPVIPGRGAISYGCVVSEGAPLVNPSIVNGQLVVDGANPKVYQDFNKSRRKIFHGFKKGTDYYFYAFAMNSVSVSPLSDAHSFMAV